MVDPYGGSVWQRMWNRSSSDSDIYVSYGNSITLSTDRALYVAGNITSSSNTDCLLTKIYTSQKWGWQFTWGESSSNENCDQIVVSPTNDFVYISGTATGSPFVIPTTFILKLTAAGAKSSIQYLGSYTSATDYDVYQYFKPIINIDGTSVWAFAERHYMSSSTLAIEGALFQISTSDYSTTAKYAGKTTFYNYGGGITYTYNETQTGTAY